MPPAKAYAEIFLPLSEWLNLSSFPFIAQSMLPAAHMVPLATIPYYTISMPINTATPKPHNDSLSHAFNLEKRLMTLSTIASTLPLSLDFQFISNGQFVSTLEPKEVHLTKPSLVYHQPLC